MFCDQCGAGVPADARFCGECGATVAPPPVVPATGLPLPPPRIRSARKRWRVALALGLLAGGAAVAAVAVVLVLRDDPRPAVARSPAASATQPAEPGVESPAAPAATGSEEEGEVPPEPAPIAYAEQVAPALTTLGRSAEDVGVALLADLQPSDLGPLRRVILRERGAVGQARRELAALEPDLGHQAAHDDLLATVQLHARYLTLLLDATAPGASRPLDRIEEADQTLGRAYAGYAGFFAAEPSLDDRITNSTMGETSALRVAVQMRLVVARHPGEPSSVGAPAIHSGWFTAVDRLERCYVTDALVVCSAGPSGKLALLQPGAGPDYLGIIGSWDNGGPSMPLGTSFRTPGGTIECGSSTRGITCLDLTGSGGGFVIGDYVVRLLGGDEEAVF